MVRNVLRLLNSGKLPAGAPVGRFNEVPHFAEWLRLRAGFFPDQAGETHAHDILAVLLCDIQHFCIQRDDFGLLRRRPRPTEVLFDGLIHLRRQEISQRSEIAPVVGFLQLHEVLLRVSHELLDVEFRRPA